MGNVPLAAVLSSERADLMQKIRADTNEAAEKLGLNVVDFRIRRADLPQANAEAIYQRMQSEREREAKEFRAQGAEVAQRIRARAERERTVLIAAVTAAVPGTAWCKAMRKRSASTPMHSARILSSSPSTARWRLTERR